MADTENEGRLEAEATQGPPVPEKTPSSTGAGSTTPDVAALEARLASLESKASVLDKIDDKIDARFKSAKDVRLAKVDEIYAWVKAAGGDVGKIKGDLEISELRQELAAISSGAIGTAPEDPAWAAAQAKSAVHLQGAGIAFDDPDYVALVTQYAGKVTADDWPDIVDLFATKRATKITKQTGAATAAAAVSEAGTAVTTARSYDDLAAELGKLQGQNTQEAFKKRRELRGKMREMAGITGGEILPGRLFSPEEGA